MKRRVFFALWPPPPTLDRLDGLARALEAHGGGRRMRRDSLHLTLAFIGAVEEDRLPVLAGAASTVRAPAGAFALDTLGHWPHKQIAWAGCHALPSCLRRLSAELADALRAAGFDLEQRPFVPHVTLLRNARAGRLLPLGEPVAWPVERFSLVESHLHPSGAHYRRIADWQL